MARSFGRRSRLRSSKPIHPTTWCGTDAYAQTISTEGSALLNICTEAEMEKYTNPTVVRIRGRLVITLSFSTTATPQDQFQLALGIVVAPTGLTAFPSMLTSDGMEVPWLWTHYTHAITEKFALYDSDANTQSEASAGRWQEFVPIDVKAMRRIPKDHFLALQYTFDQIAGTPSAVLRGSLRALIKE